MVSTLRSANSTSVGTSSADGIGSLFRDDRFQRVVLVAPTVVFLLALTAFPFVFSVYLSLYNASLIQLGNRAFVGLSNYIDLFFDDTFRSALVNTGLLAVCSISLQILFGLVIAKVFYELRRKWWITVARSAMLVPMMTTPLAIGIIAQYVFNPNLGIVNYLLGLVGINPVAWFGHPIPAKFTVLLINVWQWTPFVAILLLSALLSIPEELAEAARVDGAKWYHIFFWIEVPEIAGVMMLSVVLMLIEVARWFAPIYITTRGGPGNASEVLTIFTYQQDFVNFSAGKGSAAAVVILVISIITATVAVKLVRRIEDNA